MEIKSSSVSLLKAKGIDLKVISDAQDFLKARVNGNTSFSFDSPDILINHCMQVMDIAIDIASQEPDCDLLVISLGALFHDIGKAAKKTLEVLKDRHAEFNWSMASEFLNSIELTPKQIEALKNILYEKQETYETCIEQKIIKEADIISFMKDEDIQKSLYTWTDALQPGNGTKELQKKLDRISRLSLQRSKELAKKPYENMKNKWGLNNTTQ